MRVAFLVLFVAACSSTPEGTPAGLATLEAALHEHDYCLYCGPSCSGWLYPCDLGEAENFDARGECVAPQKCGSRRIYGPTDPNDPTKRDQ